MARYGRGPYRGPLLILSGILAVLLAVYFVFNPRVYSNSHPYPLIGLLVITAAAAFWLGIEAIRESIQ